MEASHVLSGRDEGVRLVEDALVGCHVAELLVVLADFEAHREVRRVPAHCLLKGGDRLLVAPGLVEGGAVHEVDLVERLDGFPDVAGLVAVDAPDDLV